MAITFLEQIPEQLVNEYLVGLVPGDVHSKVNHDERLLLKLVTTKIDLFHNSMCTTCMLFKCYSLDLYSSINILR